MTPYTPLELHQMNPHGLDYDSRVILPDGTLGTVIKAGLRYGTVATDGGEIWKGKLTDLRPHVEGEATKPRVTQLSLLSGLALAVLLASPAMATEKPPCADMEARPGGSPGWMAWGPVVDGQHKNLLGIPASWGTDRARAELESYGYCTSQASAPTPTPVEASPLEVNHQRLTNLDNGHPAGNDSGLAGLAAVAVVLGALWASRDGGDDGLAPAPRPIPHQPRQDALLQPVAPLPIPTPSTLPTPAPVGLPVATVATMTAPETEGMMMPSTPSISPRLAPETRPVDVSETLAQRLRPTLITANPRQGKGIVVSYAWRRAKAERDASIWLIQPKAHPAEIGYWQGVDNALGFMAEDYLSASQSHREKLTSDIIKFIQEWRRASHRPTVLIFDELSLIKAIFPQWYGAELVPQILTEMSSGETDHRAFWGITQSPLARDIGLSGGNRAPFDLVAIESKETEEHLRSIARSYAGVPLPSDDSLYARSESPKQTIIYHSALGDWAPMPRYAPWEPTANVPSEVQQPEPAGTLTSRQGSALAVEVQNMNVQPEPAPLALSEPEPALIDQVLRMRADGLTQDQIIEVLWGAKKGGSTAYKRARDEYQFIIEAYS